MVRIIAMLAALATTGCIYPYGGYGYGEYPYGYAGPPPRYWPAYGGYAPVGPGYSGWGYPSAGSDYNPISGNSTGSE